MALSCGAVAARLVEHALHGGLLLGCVAGLGGVVGCAADVCRNCRKQFTWEGSARAAAIARVSMLEEVSLALLWVGANDALQQGLNSPDNCSGRTAHGSAAAEASS